MPKKPEMVPPAGLMLCGGENKDCGKVAYNGTKGGAKPTDELDCDGKASCDDGDCDCKLCYAIKFKNHDNIFIFLPWTDSTSAKPMRSQVEEIEKDEKKRAKEVGLVVETIDWKCFCLKDKPITGKRGG